MLQYAGDDKSGRAAPKSKVAASHLPLVVPEKLNRTKVLVECPGDSEATDLDGDIGAVGRFNIVGVFVSSSTSPGAYEHNVVRAQCPLGVLQYHRMLPHNTEVNPREVSYHNVCIRTTECYATS